MNLRIRHKLFLTIFLTSSLVAAALFFFLQWSFDRGFLNYVNKQEINQLDSLALELATFYEQQESWEGLRDNHFLWINLQKRFIGNVHPPEPQLVGEHRPPPRQLGPPPDSAHFARRLTLLDAAKNRIIGGGPGEEKLAMATIPIELAGKTIGFLGLLPVARISSSGDLQFVQEQKTTFAVVALMMLGISMLLTFPVTSHLLRPINYLTQGTRKLIGGSFSTRIPVTSGDELGKLSEHFNLLATTLEENETARRRWIADISHELRTPLAILRGEMEALQDGIRKFGPETLDPLHGEILRIERLVGDLYELSMSDIGALTYKRVAVDVLGILSSTVELYETRYADKGLILRLERMEGGQQILLADPDRLQQLFTNLLENSLRYTDAPGRLEIRTEISGNTLGIRFSDSAPGVSREQLPLLFERLYRGEQSRSRAMGGAGLGLAICSKIVEAHQGKIQASQSALGGLEILLELPITS